MPIEADRIEGDYVTYVLPCLNEAKTLPDCIRQIKSVINRINKPASIIVSDNGSSDKSREIAIEMGAGIVDAPIRGYGSAVMSGCSAAQGRFIVIGDADGSYNFGESIQLLDELEKGYDLALGSRLKGKILPHAMPWINRYFGNPILTMILNVFFHSKITDAHCGLRAITRDAFEKLKLRCIGMEFASEMIIKASILGLRITEIPITLMPDRRDRKPHLRPWQDGWRHLKLLLLYSPRWLYFLPGSFMLIIGLLLGITLNIIPQDQFIYISQLFLGTHWIVPATLLAVLGLQMIWLGLFSVSHSVNIGLYPSPAWFSFSRNLITFGRSAILGIGLVALGTFMEIFIFIKWVSTHFGELEEVRLAVFGMMWIILGFETITNSFFLDFLNSVNQES